MNFNAIIGIIVSTFLFALLWAHKSATISICINKDPDYLVKDIKLQYLDPLSRIVLWLSALWILVCIFTVKIPMEISFQSIGSLFLFCGYVLSAGDRHEARQRAIATFTNQLEIEKEKKKKMYSDNTY